MTGREQLRIELVLAILGKELIGLKELDLQVLSQILSKRRLPAAGDTADDVEHDFS
jgi:hypothetical protein